MAQHHLDRPQVGAVVKQVRGKRVADDVRAQRAREVLLEAVLFENFPEADAGQRPAASVDEQPRRRGPFQQRRPRRPLIARDPVGRLFADSSEWSCS